MACSPKPTGYLSERFLHNPAFAPARFMNELSKLKEKSGNFKQLLEKRKLINRSNYPSEILRSSKLSGYLMDASKIESKLFWKRLLRRLAIDRCLALMIIGDTNWLMLTGLSALLLSQMLF